MKISSDGKIETVSPFKKRFTIQEMQEAVNGLVDMVDLTTHKCYLIKNEEGKLLDLPINRLASIFILDEFGNEAGVILGDVLIAQYNEVD